MNEGYRLSQRTRQTPRERTTKQDHNKQTSRARHQHTSEKASSTVMDPSLTMSKMAIRCSSSKHCSSPKRIIVCFFISSIFCVVAAAAAALRLSFLACVGVCALMSDLGESRCCWPIYTSYCISFERVNERDSV